MTQELTAPAYANVAYGPWTLAMRPVEIREGQPGWRVQVESPNYKFDHVTVMTYRSYDEAAKKFGEVAASIDPNVTAETERKILCLYCKKELGGDAAFHEVVPHLPNDFGYCGCRGWD